MQSHVLFEFLPNENRDELDDRVQRTYLMLKQMIAGVTTPKESQETYLRFISVKQQPQTTQPPAAAKASTTTTPVQVGSLPPVDYSTLTTNVPLTSVANQSPTNPNAPVNATTPPTTNSNNNHQCPPTTNPQNHSNLEDLTMGLLVATLAEADTDQTRYYQDVISFSKDNLNLFSTYLNMLVIEKVPKMRESTLKKIIWLINQLIKSNSTTPENILHSLIRQIQGGDISRKNLILTEGILDLLIENRTWLMNSTIFLVPLVIYNYMRLLLDHHQDHVTNKNHQALIQKETNFLICIIREKFTDCLVIGRDFLRLLYQIKLIPEFEKLWNEICNNPRTLHPTFEGPMQIMCIKTPRRLISSRLTFELERRIQYFASQIKFGHQKAYQDQFFKKFLHGPETQSLRSDIIRYICANIHPSNEVLCSDIIPRWAIIGWLLGTCTAGSSLNNAKLALFYDWLVYEPDSIMNMEPGILVMYFSIKSYQFLTETLMDYFCKLPDLFIPILGDQFRNAIKLSLSLMIEKSVIKNVPYLMDNPKYDPALKALIAEKFPEYFTGKNQSATSSTVTPQTIPNVTPTTPVTSTLTQPSITLHPNNNSALSSPSQTTITDNGISATKQQQQTTPISPIKGSSTTTPNQVMAPKPPNHLPLGNKQDHIVTGIDPLLKTSSPTDAPVVGSVANMTIAPNKVNNIDNNSMIINSGDSVTTTTKKDKLNHNPKPYSGTIRPESPEIMMDDQSITWQKYNNLTNDSDTSSKQTTANCMKVPTPQTSTEDNSKNNNNMTKITINQPVAKTSTTLDPNSNVLATSLQNPIDTDSSINHQTTLTNAQNLKNFSPMNNDMNNYYENDIPANSNYTESCQATQKVLYPFMMVPDLDFNETIEEFEDEVKDILSDLNKNRCNDTRCNMMDKLISTVFDSSGNTSLGQASLKNLGHCLAYLFVDDFSKRIFPQNPVNALLTGGARLYGKHQSLENSITSPLFLLCRRTFFQNKPDKSIMTLLVNVYKHLEATGFLVLYFLRANAVIEGFGSNVAGHYIEFCNHAKRKPLNKVLNDDLNMAVTYDSDLFCFLLPSVFGEMASCGSFTITGNIDIIRLVVANLDPLHLEELLCLCLTGTSKVINKDEVLPLIESSLIWESWEQYSVWRLICAQSVPIENYLSILPKLNPKIHSEAMSSILLNLQKVTEPTFSMLQTLITCDCKLNDPFVSSILRYWSMRTDVHDLARLITSLVDTPRPPSPPVKRKGAVKPKSTPTQLGPQTEKILYHLESIRQRAPKNKLLVQNEIIEMIAQMEVQCNEEQKKAFEYLFLNRPKINKKQKKVE